MLFKASCGTSVPSLDVRGSPLAALVKRVVDTYSLFIHQREMVLAAVGRRGLTHFTRLPLRRDGRYNSTYRAVSIKKVKKIHKELLFVKMPGFAWFLTCIKTTFIPPTSLFLENIFGIFAFLGGLVAPPRGRHRLFRGRWCWILPVNRPILFLKKPVSS